MTAGAPRDPLFYKDLEAFGQRTGVRPEDALFIWASESGLDNQLAGDSRTFSTLMHYVAVPGLMTEWQWSQLPHLTHRQQLPWVENGIFAPAHRMIGGRAFNSAFEVYLANAAPALLRVDGIYSDDTPMYVGRNYPDNWTMDNYPAGVAAYSAWAAGARARGEKQSLRAAYGVAEDLINRGVLKGYVSLGDLRNFGKRMLRGGGGIATEAIGYLNNVRASIAAGRSPSITAVAGYFAGRAESPALAHPSASAYVPDFDSPVKSGVPADTRVATPAAARDARPSLTVVRMQNLATGEQGPAFLTKAVLIGGGIAVVLAIAIAFAGRTPPRSRSMGPRA